MSLEKYTFSLLSGAVETPVTPSMTDLIFEDSIEDKLLGIYRRRIKSDMIFVGPDYDLLLAYSEFGNAWDFLVKYEGVEKYRGRLIMGTSQIKFDADSCLAYVNVDPVDDYTCLLDSWENEINILSGGDIISAGTILGDYDTWTCETNPCIFEDQCREYVNCFGQPPEDFGWTLTGHVISTEETGDWKAATTYVREYINVDCLSGAPPGDGWILVEDNCPTSKKYARTVPTTYNAAASFDNGPQPADPNGPVIWYVETYSIAGRSSTGGAFEFDNARLLSWILSNFQPCLSGGSGIVSDFFSINGDDTYPANDPYTQAKLYLGNMAVFQKSDVKRANATQNATIGKWTYKELLESLAEQFNLRIAMTGGVLRIEHVSYWQSVEGLDLTTLNGGKWIIGKNEWSYEDDDAARKETWKFMEDASEAFTGDPIYYTLPSSLPEEKQHPIGRVNNDIGYITTYQDRVSDDGFVWTPLFTSGGQYSLMTHVSVKTGESLLNGYMSIPNLQHNFHKYNRLFKKGTMNGTQQQFVSWVKRKKQEEIQIRLGHSDYWAFNPENSVKTQLGNGQVVRAEFSAKHCTLKLDLNHD